MQKLGKVLFIISWLCLLIDIPYNWLIFLLLLRLSSKLKKMPEKIKIKKSSVKKISEYFTQQEKLIYDNELYFQCPNQQFINLNSIEVYYHNEKICTLDEFKQYYPKQYPTLIEHLLPYLNLPSPQQQEPIQEESLLQTYIEQINEYNIQIQNESISLDLYKTVALLKQLDLLEKKYPKTSAKLNKLNEYYLPIVLEILENYTHLQATHSNSEELNKLEEKLRKSVVLINEAIKNITSSLFEEEKMNLSADMNVLEALLKKDGLIEDEMNLEQLNAMMKE